MSWYYSINDGAYESKDKQSLRSFLDNVAAHISDSGRHSFQIKSLELRYVFGWTDGYPLSDARVAEVQKYLDSILADYESDAEQILIYGSYSDQVQSIYMRSVL